MDMNTKTYTVITVVVVIVLLIALGYFSYTMLFTNRGDGTRQTASVLNGGLSSDIPAEGRYIRVTAPNGGESLCVDETVGIRWSSRGVERVRVGVAADGKVIGSGTEVPASAGFYSWMVPDLTTQIDAGTTNFVVYVTEVATSTEPVGDTSDTTFTVDACENVEVFDKG
jgi:hypothetical protein